MLVIHQWRICCVWIRTKQQHWVLNAEHFFNALKLSSKFRRTRCLRKLGYVEIIANHWYLAFYTAVPISVAASENNWSVSVTLQDLGIWD